MKKQVTFTIDGVSFCIFYSPAEDVIRIYREGMNGGELRYMGGDKWRRFDSGCLGVGVIIVQVAEFLGAKVLQVQRERTETLFCVDLVSAK